MSNKCGDEESPPPPPKTQTKTEDNVKKNPLSTKPSKDAKDEIKKTLSRPFLKKSAKKSENKAPQQKPYTLRERYIDIKTGFSEIRANMKEKKTKGKSGSQGGPGQGRVMIYPYTFSAKVAQFPYKFYFNNCWLFRYHLYGLVCTFPLFFYIAHKSYDPQNVEFWRKEREKLFAPAKH